MAPNFEVFHQPTPAADPATVTISSTGVSLNKAAVNLLGRRPRTVELLFDRDNRIMGIRPVIAVPAGEGTMFQLDVLRDGGGARIATREFADHYQIPTTHRWPAYLDGGVLCAHVCCDLHGIHCEPPADLCCRHCTEGTHPQHPAGVVCVLDMPVAGGSPTPARRNPVTGTTTIETERLSDGRG